MNHVSVSPTDGNGPTQGQRKTLTRVGIEQHVTWDKTPGTDGLPCEFYKVFWRDVSQILISALNYSYDAGTLSVSQGRGVILNNRWSSNFFKLSRGVRQGFPLSAYLFILAAEIMAETFRKSKKIRGITIKDTDIKLSQYADDTTLVLDGSEESLKESIELLDSFSRASGLRLNSKKKEALWIGSKANAPLKVPLTPKCFFR